MKKSSDILDLIGITSLISIRNENILAKEHPEWIISTVLQDRAESYFSTGLLGE